MIQRISVRLRIMLGGKTLIVRRSEGRKSILGKYEIPGGRVTDSEQPEDAARRFMASLGIDEPMHLRLEDVMTYIDSDEDRLMQYAVVVYRVSLNSGKRAIKLSGGYDKYIWYTIGKVDYSLLTDVSNLVLGTLPTPVALPDVSHEVKSSAKGVVVYADGGSRGNPGPSAAGYVVIDQGEIVDQGGEYLGITTNNQAEYHGARIGLEAAARLGVKNLDIKLDSMLVVNQLNNIYKIKNRELWPVNERVRELVDQFDKVKFAYVPREMNQLADGMVNKTLDRQKLIDQLGAEAVDSYDPTTK